ncbi:tannase and feruloyl esterase [Meira miltonrushii]|uniref:Carboxylic ester hydrolase n=1 Tax=Meira miltonrushii TaxID=1280837 RepID=A0A316VCL9_9BASI|nr:tannase and feruloyl esterase [Meira miltonrushii]PWN35302.1 tannase and feruloyl esterase [Meira miltonrushii]
MVNLRYDHYCWIILSLILSLLLASVEGNQHPQTGHAVVESKKKCASLAETFKLPNTKILLAEYVENGTTINLQNLDPTCGSPNITVNSNICRVSWNTTTGYKSGFRFEAFLPIDWSGRFVTLGNGGTGGCILYGDLDSTAKQGFAAVDTNNGHDGDHALPFFHNKGVQQDYAYRAVRMSARQGKHLVRAFYGKSARKSYYVGCSTGGRQGFKEAQDAQIHFDGILAGSPAIDFNHLNSWGASFLPITGSNTSAGFITFDQWTGIIHDDVLRKCDGLDGYKDGIIEDTLKCHYTADDLLCPSGSANRTDCLTEDQVKIVNRVYSPMRSIKGEYLYPRIQPGAEGFEAVIVYLTGTIFGYSDWQKYVVFKDPNWNASAFDPANYTKAQELNPFGIQTFNGDLSAFRKNGGKILHYHGNEDGIISAEISPRYYDLVSKTMKLAPHSIDQFYRFFRVSGMGHCGNGQGAHFIGNSQANLGPTNEPEDSVLWALVRWVEKGIAPDYITGTAYVNGSRDTGIVDYQRKHCRYPFSNVYQGKGDPKDPNSWKCIYPQGYGYGHGHPTKSLLS